MDGFAASPRLVNRLRLRQVALLLEIRADGTLRGAAARLGMTQPAATKMLHELEAALGCALFERQGRGLRPTAAGNLVVEHFEGLRGSIDAMVRALAALQSGAGGTLAIGSIVTPAPTLLTRVVARLKSEQPRLLVTIGADTSDRLLSLLDQGALDVVIGRLVEGYSRRDYRFEPIGSEGLSVAVGAQHPLVGARRVTLRELATRAWIMHPRLSPMREVVDQEFRRCGVDPPEDVVETSSIVTITSLLAETERIAVVPTEVAEYYVRYGMLAILPLSLSQALEPFGWIVRRGRPLSGSARRFIELLSG
jgi:DNA-binding transcriptional LysR family regulator